MSEFDAGKNKYRVRRLNAFQQFDIARPLFPVITDIVEAAQSGMKPGDVMRVVGEAIAAMKTEDAHKILKMCLLGAERQSGAGWAAVYLPGPDRMMFEDIGLMEMMTIAMKVIEEHLKDFFSGQP